MKHHRKVKKMMDAFCKSKGIPKGAIVPKGKHFAYETWHKGRKIFALVSGSPSQPDLEPVRVRARFSRMLEQ